ncbi:MAG TPA: BrnA antitoxin family protein [Woeseiaceae bacterium]|nr:BrnA antitoxin family protein [Woeseiaceae bacterium]
MRKEYDFSKAQRGSVAKANGKSRITIYIDDDILEAYRKKGDELGRGYQTLINEALRESLVKKAAVDARTIRRIVREELEKAG